MFRIRFTYRFGLLTACLLLQVPATAEQPPAKGEASDRLTWPQDQVLPRFENPAELLDAISVQSLTREEQLTFVALQGHVNKSRPRIWLVNKRSEEGHDTWLHTLKKQIGTTYNYRNKYALVAKYLNAIQGVVLYDAERNPHMRNLAATVAGLQEALPVTSNIRTRLIEQGIDLPVVADLTGLKLTTALDAYEYLHQHYWPDCEKRFLVSARAEGRGGDYHHTRDLAAACGAAAVWLDCRKPDERALLGKFLADMPTGNAVVLGWHASERSGVTTATEYGIGTMPSDHFMNASVLSGSSVAIRPPNVPATPKLENKLYVAILFSDGDNIQYTQHAMRRIWDRSKSVRGEMPLNWTIAPGLVDIAPEILNYYYSTATSKDCFVCGPSGMGYILPVNTLAEPGARLGNMLDDESRMDSYARLTSRYLQRAGLRVLTIWDNASPMQRALYERRCQGLLGVTVQNFKDDPTVKSSLENERLRFERLAIPYASTTRHLQTSLAHRANQCDGTSAQFVAYQADIWSELKPERLVELMRNAQEQFPHIEFVRADHYFQLQAQARRQNPAGEDSELSEEAQ